MCLGASISEKWVLISKTSLDMLNQYSVTIATIGKNPSKLNIAGKQRINKRSVFILVVVSIFTAYWRF